MKVSALGAVLALAAAAIISGCASGMHTVMPTPDRPGTSIKVSNPNVGKWTVFQPTQRRSNARFYACKPMACAADAMVAINTAPSPTRNPDRIALEKAAKLLPAQARAQDIMMEAASEGDERQTSLSSKVTEMRGYPAIIAEVRRTTRAKVRYIMRGDLFVGNILVKIVSILRRARKPNEISMSLLSRWRLSTWSRLFLPPIRLQAMPRLPQTIQSTGKRQFRMGCGNRITDTISLYLGRPDHADRAEKLPLTPPEFPSTA